MFYCQKGLALPVVFLFFASSLFSQKNNLDSISLKTVVIQATRAGKGSAVPHTNFSAAKIEKSLQAQDVPFLLTSVPSLVESSDAGNGVGYTGIRIRGTDPTRTNVTINGIPLNDAESQGVYWVNLPDLAASASEIQVQRGVGNSTNGAGAFGATVNLDLSQVKAEPWASVANTFGSFGTRRHSVMAGTGLLNGHWAFTGRLSNLHSDGFIDRAESDLNAYHISGAYIDQKQTFMAHLISGHEVTYQAWNGVPAQYIDDPALRTFNSAGTEKAGAPYQNEVDNYTQRHGMLHWKRVFSPDLSLQLNGHYTKGFGYFEQYKAAQSFSKYGLEDISIGDSVLSQTDLVRRRWLDNQFYGSTFALRFEPNAASTADGPTVFTIGGAASRYEGRHFGEVIWAQYAVNIPESFNYYDNNATKTDWNLFGKIEKNFSKKYTASLDLQARGVGYQFLGYDNDANNVAQSAKHLFFNPKLSLSADFNPKLNAYTFVGIANREPNRDDYTQSTPASRPLSERLFDVETGVKYRQKRWSSQANFYGMWYENQLILDGRINDVGAYIRTNVPKSYRMGVELETAIQATDRISFAGNLCLSRNKIPTFIEYRDNWDTYGQEIVEHKNTDLLLSPNRTARLEGIFEALNNKRNDLALALAVKHVGRQFLDNTSNENTQLKAYSTLDFRLNYNLKAWLGNEVRFTLAVNNLLNQKYSANGWTYRYISAGYDDRPYNAYTRLEGNAVYNQTGFFPQAGTNIMGTVQIKLGN